MPRPPLPNTITLRVVSTYEFGEGNRTDVQPALAEQEWLNIVWEEGQGICLLSLASPAIASQVSSQEDQGCDMN